MTPFPPVTADEVLTELTRFGPHVDSATSQSGWTYTYRGEVQLLTAESLTGPLFTAMDVPTEDGGYEYDWTYVVPQYADTTTIPF